MTYPTSDVRDDLLARIASAIPRADDLGRNVLVGIDGVDGSGKTVFADALGATLAYLQPTVRISIDGFHRRRPERYRLGRDSPEGFFQDSYDYEAFVRHVVVPLRSGAGPYLVASHDLDNDELLDGPLHHLDTPSVVLVDGIFLHRPELRDVWDFSIFLRVAFAVSVARMAVRDGSDPDPDAASNARYVGGQRIYLGENDPESRATLIVDNNEILAPRIVPAGTAPTESGTAE